tara:strand:- start:472 stop:1215 length:744 start_codon:yes stop_codon:yes gene_type:complete
MSSFITQEERNKMINKLYNVNVEANKSLLIQEDKEDIMRSVLELEYNIYIESNMYFEYKNIDIRDSVPIIKKTIKEKKEYYLNRMNSIYERINRVVSDSVEKENNDMLDDFNIKTKKFNEKFEKLKQHYSFAKKFIHIIDKAILSLVEKLSKMNDEEEEIIDCTDCTIKKYLVEKLSEMNDEEGKELIASTIKIYKDIKKYLWVLIQLCEREAYINTSKINIDVLDKIQETLNFVEETNKVSKDTNK